MSFEIHPTDITEDEVDLGFIRISAPDPDIMIGEPVFCTLVARPIGPSSYVLKFRQYETNEIKYQPQCYGTTTNNPDLRPCWLPLSNGSYDDAATAIHESEVGINQHSVYAVIPASFPHAPAE